jgi:hypothetical protein
LLAACFKQPPALLGQFSSLRPMLASHRRQGEQSPAISMCGPSRAAVSSDAGPRRRREWLRERAKGDRRQRDDLVQGRKGGAVPYDRRPADGGRNDHAHGSGQDGKQDAVRPFACEVQRQAPSDSAVDADRGAGNRLAASPFAVQVPGECDKLGRVVVDTTLRAPAALGIFVAGDAAVADTGDGHLTLQSCQHAEQLGRVAGENAA